MNKLKVDAYPGSVKSPTYDLGQPNKHPMFFEKRVYQGSSDAGNRLIELAENGIERCHQFYVQ